MCFDLLQTLMVPFPTHWVVLLCFALRGISCLRGWVSESDHGSYQRYLGFTAELNLTLSRLLSQYPGSVR